MIRGAVNFRMPSAHLPRLSGAVLLGPEFEKYPDTTRLKLDRLVPAMSESLGIKQIQRHHPSRIRLLLLPPRSRRADVRTLKT